MKNGDYWKKRMMMLEESSHRSAQETCREISDALDDAMYQMDSVIEKWLQRIATNNGISMAEARRLLKGAELDEFKWTLSRYIKKGQENALDQQWMKELENASARAHITRLEAMELSLNQYAQEAFGQENKLTDDLLTKIYQDRYGHTAFEIAKGTGVGVTLGGINEQAAKIVLQNPWASDGKIFSDRIWASMDDMKAELHKQLTRQILTGAAPDAAINAMTKYVAQGVTSAKYRAGRLVMTESAAIGNLAQHNCYKDLGVEEFEVVATLDGHTCEECGGMDGKHFPMKQFEEGVTAPPFHANCRCVTAPFFADEAGREGYRASREGDGKTTFDVPANMTYPEWSEKAYYAKTISLSQARNIRTSSDLDEMTHSPVVKMQSVDEIVKYFKDQYGIEVSGFNKKDLFSVKATMAGYDDMVTEFPEIRNYLTKIVYNSHIRDCGKYYLYKHYSEVGPSGLKDYGTGVHEAAHALDKARSSLTKVYSEQIVEQARKNLKLRSNSRKYRDLRIQLAGIRAYNSDIEIFAYAIESQKGLAGNKLSEEILRLVSMRE